MKINCSVRLLLSAIVLLHLSLQPIALENVGPLPPISRDGNKLPDNKTSFGRLQGDKFISTPDGILTEKSGTMLSISPTGNPTNGSLLTTFSTFSVQNITTQIKNREFLTSFGFNSNKGADQEDGTGNGDKVTLYSGMVQQRGSGNAWSLNTLLTRQPGVTKSSIGYEVDLNNNDRHLGEALGAAGLERPFGYGLILTGAAPYRSTAAIEIGGPGGSFLWNRGIVISQNSVKQASFQDVTVSDISIDIRGGHQYPIDIANSGVVKAAVRLPKASQIVAGNPDKGGIRDDSKNIHVIGTDRDGNIQLGFDGSTFLIAGSSILPKSGTEDLGSFTSRFRIGFFNHLVVSPSTPNSSSSACEKGTISADENYIYVCIDSNKWRRTALGAF